MAYSTLLFRFFETLRDPKTWLFALFSAIDNIPNSLTNQRQIIVSSFGFSDRRLDLSLMLEMKIVSTWNDGDERVE